MSENLTVKERFLDFSECSYIGEVYAVIKKDVHTSQYYNQDRNEKDSPAAECE